MPSPIVKAAEERSKYIVDVFHYGVKCKTCRYDYKYYAMRDFVSLCYNVDCGDFTTTTLDSEKDCTSTVEFIPYTDCVPASQILDCNTQYTLARTMALEINSYLLNRINVLGYDLYFTFSSLIVNGVEYLNGTRTYVLTPENVNTKVVEGVTVITNLVDYLNTFNLPNMLFYVDKADRMKVSYPSSYTWQISTLCNTTGADATYGLKVDQTGVIGVELTLGGGYIAPPYGGSAAVWETNTEVLSTEYLC